MRNRPFRSTGAAAFAGLLLAASCLIAAGADAPPASLPGPVLTLTNGASVPGELRDSATSATLRWRSPAFVDPFDFSASAVNAIRWPQPAKLPEPTGEYCFEMLGGDVLYGTLIGLNDTEATIDVPHLGPLHIQRSSLRRIDRWRHTADSVYSGPNGLADWNLTKTGWREEAGDPLTDQEGATLRGNLRLPAKAVVEFELSWKTRPDFSLAIGVNDSEKMIGQAFRFEVWSGELVACRETESEADLTALQTIAAGPGRIHLRAYLDQAVGRMAVFSANGKQLADLKVSIKESLELPGVQLTNISGDVRLERLRIRRWDGKTPSESKANETHLQRADGSIAYGQIVRFDTDSKELVVKGEAGESRVPLDQISSVFLAPASEVPPRAIRVVSQDGSRLSGELIKVENGELWMSVPGVKETPRLASSALRTLVVTRHDPEALVKEENHGVLEMDGLRLPGHLVEGGAGAGASPLGWRPQGSTSSSPFRPAVTGRIVYKEPPPTLSPAQQQAVQMRAIRVAPAPAAGLAQGLFRALGSSPSRPQQAMAGRRALHLRTGDIVPCEVTKIDETGVSFKSASSDKTFVPHDKIKAVELAPEPPDPIRLNKAKRERLLTLPRMQKDSPPTQMVRSRNGDYLRGRVSEMDDKTLKVEVRLESKEIPRDRISRIIWLHPDELDKTKKPATNPEKEPAMRVQAMRSDGIRLTFAAEHFADGTVSGKSEVLGACRVRLDEVDQLLIGSAIEQAAAQFTYGKWVLQNAVEPKIAQDDGQGSDRSPGSESSLVGKPAPDFSLDLLDGKPFKLSENKGSIVVLDFWATWCGPCLQAMPQVERVAQEFKDQGVKLVAVNLQEAPKVITAMLERHKLHPAVALDRDGAVAEKYMANAIPQTVVVNRDGTVARLFIGGGPSFEANLREALTAVVKGTDKKEPEKK
ncbi:MAG: thiol-disulfide isomerase-like thioredoxin [Planctomycetota bacterium]|nr:thiol-disulfide isomerase-like thioredoxin [Planctomycetota bacterium]